MPRSTRRSQADVEAEAAAAAAEEELFQQEESEDLSEEQEEEEEEGDEADVEAEEAQEEEEDDDEAAAAAEVASDAEDSDSEGSDEESESESDSESEESDEEDADAAADADVASALDLAVSTALKRTKLPAAKTSTKARSKRREQLETGADPSPYLKWSSANPTNPAVVHEEALRKSTTRAKGGKVDASALLDSSDVYSSAPGERAAPRPSKRKEVKSDQVTSGKGW